MKIGDQVEVHTTFSDSWVAGFEIAEIVPEGYHVGRTSDGSLLPGYTSEADVRPNSPQRTVRRDNSVARVIRSRPGHP